MQEGLQRAVGVPLALAERVNVLWPYLKEMVVYGNVACKSDTQVTQTLIQNRIISYITGAIEYSRKASNVKNLLCVCYFR